MVFSLKKSKKFIWINYCYCPIFSLITSCMEDYSFIVNLIASVLSFSLDQQRPLNLTGHPFTFLENGSMYKQRIHPLEKSPPRCRVNEMIKPN